MVLQYESDRFLRQSSRQDQANGGLVVVARGLGQEFRA